MWELVDDFCIIYLNNILVFSWTKKEHMEHLQLIIKHLQCIELYANSKKCEFFKFKIKFLGFLVNKQDIWMNSKHVKSIFKWPWLQTYHDIQVFLGFCNFYWHFIYNFSGIAWPLYNLLHGLKDGKKPGRIQDFKWHKSQQETFQ